MGVLRSVVRRLLVGILRLLGRLVLWHYKPRIVAVTGSVGKTTTKDLTAAMLATRFRVRKAAGSYNSEFGVPLTILGQKMGWSIGHWGKILLDTAKLLLTKRDYPELLVLEMAADHPGDISSLARLAPPDTAIVTNVRGVHLEYYPNVEAIAEEKAELVGRMHAEGTAVLNFDDTKVRLMQASAPGRVLYYGLTDESNLWATDLKTTPGGLAATVHYRSTEDGPEETWPLKTLLLGRHQLSGILAALGAALVNGVSAEEALAAVASIGPPPGRGRVLAGKHDLTLIDDSYNASPQAVMASLEVLQQFPGPRIAVLGDMRELGRAREAGHRSVGEFAAGWLDELITVGDDAALIGQAAAAAGMKPEAIHQATAKEAAELIEAKHRGGTVLVKGSQAVYLERTVAALLADPRDAARLVKRRIPTDAP